MDVRAAPSPTRIPRPKTVTRLLRLIALPLPAGLPPERFGCYGISCPLANAGRARDRAGVRQKSRGRRCWASASRDNFKTSEDRQAGLLRGLFLLLVLVLVLVFVLLRVDGGDLDG